MSLFLFILRQNPFFSSNLSLLLISFFTLSEKQNAQSNRLDEGLNKRNAPERNEILKLWNVPAMFFSGIRLNDQASVHPEGMTNNIVSKETVK